MSCNLETPKPWGAAQQPVGRHPVMAPQVVGSREMTEPTQQGEQPHPEHLGLLLAPHSSSEDGTGSRSEAGSTAKAPGRISNRREQKGSWIERIMHLYLLEASRTHKAPKASLAKPGHTKSIMETITPSPHIPTPAQEAWSEKPGLYFQEMKTVVSADGTARSY